MSRCPALPSCQLLGLYEASFERGLKCLGRDIRTAFHRINSAFLGNMGLAAILGAGPVELAGLPAFWPYYFILGFGA